jgi:type IV pilus assembly protein PilF
MRYRFSPASRLALVVAIVAHLIAACTPANNSDSPGLVKTDPAADTYVQLARTYLSRGNTMVAFENAQKAVATDPKSVEGHTIMGLILQSRGDSNNAAKHYVKAKKLAPYDPFVSNAYGTYLCSNGLYGEADREFLTASKSPLNQAPWVALTNAGLCYERNGQYAMARQRLQSALALNSKFSQASEALKRLHGRG